MATDHHPTDRLPPVAIELAALSKTGDLTKFALGTYGQPGAATLAMLDDQVKKFTAAGAVATKFANQGAAIAATMQSTVDRYAALSASLAPPPIVGQYASIISSIQAEQKRNSATAASLLATRHRLTEAGERATALFREAPPLTDRVVIPPAPVEPQLLAEIVGLQKQSLEAQGRIVEQQAQIVDQHGAVLEIQRQGAELGRRAVIRSRVTTIAAVVAAVAAVLTLILR
jgi:hypothetical protein